MMAAGARPPSAFRRGAVCPDDGAFSGDSAGDEPGDGDGGPAKPGDKNGGAPPRPCAWRRTQDGERLPYSYRIDGPWGAPTQVRGLEPLGGGGH